MFKNKYNTYPIHIIWCYMVQVDAKHTGRWLLWVTLKLLLINSPNTHQFS